MKHGLLGILLCISFWAGAQHQDPNWSARRAVIDEQCVNNDSLCHVLKQLGTFEGHLRTFFMGTTNYQEYPDYHALAVGGGLGYYSPVIKNFQIGMSGFIIHSLSASNLARDSLFSNRYEIGLFDITDPYNGHDLDRLEDLYLRYYISFQKNSYIQVGKFHLSTPLVNLQDGRMRPNLQEGAWMHWNPSKGIHVKAGWLWRTSPRSTVEWYTMGESVGVYPMGQAVNGEKAHYEGHVHTPGISIGQFEFAPIKNLDVQLWNYYVPDLFNISYSTIEWKKRKDNHEWMLGTQYLWQQSLFKESLPIEEQYIGPNEQAHVVSARLQRAHIKNHTSWSINYTHITKDGRFLLPREWGVEPFYTFMSRERLEGSGNVHAFTLSHARTLDKAHHFKIELAGGTVHRPDFQEARFNKYALPSYYQFNARARYKFEGFLHGLQANFLYVGKGALTKELEISPSNYHNKVGMHHFSIMLDYYF